MKEKTSEDLLKESTFLKEEILLMITTRYKDLPVYTAIGVFEIVKSILIDSLDAYEGSD